MATYLLPTLSGLAVDKKYPEFRATLNKGMEHLLFLNLLAGVLLAVLAAPIIRLLFEHRMFSAGDTQDTAQALTLLAPGLIAYSLVNVMARAFYALRHLHANAHQRSLFDHQPAAWRNTCVSFAASGSGAGELGHGVPATGTACLCVAPQVAEA
jgi:hypothetical protein